MYNKRMINRNEFNLDHTVDQTTKFGQLLPFLIQEVVPGDTMKINTDCLIRFMPMTSPAYADIYGKMDLFFVPNRLVWKNWENFITGGEDGKDNSVAPYVQYTEGGLPAKSLYTYLGVGDGYKGAISALPARAINLIWNEWYRDQNLQDKRAVSLEDGLDNTTDTTIPFRNFEKDYYTCAFPYAQKGDPVLLPLGSTASVLSNGKTPDIVVGGVSGKLTQRYNLITGPESGVSLGNTSGPSGIPTGQVTFGSETGLYADLTRATASTVEDIRKAFQIQKFQFLNLRGGSRYVEYIYNYYGVRSSDARVQRPELIASNTFDIQINEVLQTSDSTQQNTPTGSMYGHGIGTGETGIIEKSFEEHGFLIGLYSIQPRTSYMQMVERHFTRFSKYDYYNPTFAFLGYQAIENKEIFSKSTNPSGVFGFQGRYDEMRHRQSYVCGDFRGNLKYWNCVREFDSQPLLNSSFINATNSSDRIFQDTVDDYILCKFYNNIDAFRPLPKDSDPGLIDHIYY